MPSTHWLRAAAISFVLLSACNSSTSNQASSVDGNAAASEQSGAVDKLAPVEMQADTSYLNPEEREVVNLLIRAADLMNPIYLRQVSAENPR